ESRRRRRPGPGTARPGGPPPPRCPPPAGPRAAPALPPPVPGPGGRLPARPPRCPSADELALEHRGDVVVGPGDDMGRDDLAHLRSGRRPGVDGRLDGPDVALDEDCHQPAADL